MALERTGRDPKQVEKSQQAHLNRILYLAEKSGKPAPIKPYLDPQEAGFFSIGKSEEQFGQVETEICSFMERLKVISVNELGGNTNNTYKTGSIPISVNSSSNSEFIKLEGKINNLQVNYNYNVNSGRSGQPFITITVKDPIAEKFTKKHSNDHIKAALRIYFDEELHLQRFVTAGDPKLMAALLIKHNNVNIPFITEADEYGLIATKLGLPRTIDEWKQLFHKYGKVSKEQIKPL